MLKKILLLASVTMLAACSSTNNSNYKQIKDINGVTYNSTALFIESSKIQEEWDKFQNKQ